MNGRDSIVAIKEAKLPDPNIMINGKSGSAIIKERLGELNRLKDLLPQLKDPNICSPHMMLQSHNCFLQIMPLGRMTLGTYVAQLLFEHKQVCERSIHFGCNAGMTIAQVLHYFEQILNPLCYLHKQGLLNGDVKSDNVVFLENGVLQLIDLDSIRSELSSSISGTPGYAGAEVYKGKTEQKSDVHSASSILPEILGLFMMHLLPDNIFFSIAERTIDRNVLVFRFMMQFEHLKPFGALFRWGTSAMVSERPTIFEMTKMFKTHETFNQLRQQVQGCPVTVHISHNNNPKDSDAATVFKNWMIKRLPQFKE